MSDSWERLRADCASCQGCALAETRKNVVFGTGSETAELLFVGEGPGASEDAQGIPFVGKAGQLLDDMLGMIGLHRSQVYIANIVKCRPPQNRDPLNTERQACTPFLQRQQALLRPKLLVCLGRIAAQDLIKPDFKITQEHGQWFERDGLLLTAIYHPAALLRDPAKGPETFQDLKGIQEKLLQLCPGTPLQRDWLLPES